MGKATAAVGGVILATGLVGMGGTAFANTNHAEPAPEPQPQPQPTEHTTKADAPEGRDLVGVNAPVALDLHKGIANDLHAHDVAKDIAVVGDVVPAGPDGNAQPAAKSSDDGKSTTSASTAPRGVSSSADAKGHEGKGDDGGGPAPVRPIQGAVQHVDSTVNKTVHGVIETGQELNPAR